MRACSMQCAAVITKYRDTKAQTKYEHRMRVKEERRKNNKTEIRSKKMGLLGIRREEEKT